LSAERVEVIAKFSNLTVGKGASKPNLTPASVLFVLRGCTVVRLEFSKPFHADGPSQQRLGKTLTDAEVRSGRDRRG
jgi:hypothetical protein